MGREGSTIEMERPRRARGSAPEDTDYHPVDWKRLFLRPKYLGMCIRSDPPAYEEVDSY